MVAGWRARAAVESPSHLRSPDQPDGDAAGGAAGQREREITDTLVELLIATVHRIGARAEQKVTNELINAFKRVTGKENILLRIAEASLAAPEGTVAPGGVPALSAARRRCGSWCTSIRPRAPVYRRTVQTTLKASYTNHYRAA